MTPGSTSRPATSQPPCLGRKPNDRVATGSQIGNLTPDHKKLGIDLTSMRANGVQYTIGKLSTLLQLCFNPHLDWRSE